MVETLQVSLKNFQRDCTVSIWLPKGYNTGDELYPVLYLLDGDGSFASAPGDPAKSVGIMEYMAGWDKEMIVVSIPGLDDKDLRREEYCPFSYTKKDGTKVKGRGEETLQWLMDTLKPLIDGKYRTNPFRLCTSIAGSGMAGTLALYALGKYNRTFSKAACLSCELGEQCEAMSTVISASFVDSNTRLFLSWGSKEFDLRDDYAENVGRNLQLNRLFVMQGALTYPYQCPDGAFDRLSWMGQIPLFLHYLWKE